MIDALDRFLLEKDIRNWYYHIGQDYCDYDNPDFGLSIVFKLSNDNFYLTISKDDYRLVKCYPFEEYSKMSDFLILDSVIKLVWELYNGI